MGRKAGLTDQKLLAVARLNLTPDDFAVFTDNERLAVELADAMTETPSNIADDLYARLRSAFSEEQLLELSAQIAFENFRSRLNRVFNIQSDNLYHPANP